MFFCANPPSLTFVHRLILTTVLVTSKMFNDTYYTNQYIASFGGVTLRNMNELEAFFMQMIDWRLNITEEEFAFYDNSLLAFQESDPAQPFPAALVAPFLM